MCKTSLFNFCKRKSAPSILRKLKVRYVKLIQLFTKGFQIFVQHFYVHQCNAFQPDDGVSILCDLSEGVFAHRVEDCPFLVANVFLFLSSQQFSSSGTSTEFRLCAMVFFSFVKVMWYTYISGYRKRTLHFRLLPMVKCPLDCFLVYSFLLDVEQAKTRHAPFGIFAFSDKPLRNPSEYSDF